MQENPRPPRRWRAVVGAVVAAVLAAGVGVGTAAGAQAATVDTSTWYVLVNRQSTKAMEVAGWSTADGAVVQQWARNDGAWQQWRFVAAGDGWYRLVNRHSGKALDLWEWSTADGASFRQFTDLNATNQHFRLTDSEGGRVRLLNRHSGKAVTVTDRSTADGATVTQLTNLNQYNQQWQLVPVGSVGSNPGTGFPAWPTTTGQVDVSATIAISGTRDMGMVRYYGLGDEGQDEGQDPMFRLADGAVLKNVILGTGAADGIHCTGTCTLENVWWEDVGEDAATFRGSSASQTMTVVGGGARSASDKVFQHNGPGTFVIRNFQASGFGKLYRSCGNCSTQHARTVRVENVQVTTPASSLVGINSNYGDRATLTGVIIVNDASRKVAVCEEYRGVTSGEPTKISSGPSTACGYSTSSITYR
ncbi:pectate lyase [Cellulomonas sp. SLBN-39]|uniref:pectate lyase n=1 Tax=Cellulomonas sp. SLBN-39 TaxID=2768446 RepID=UPI00114FDF6D|nr:pectate lyase [Cellulomonas sp. SLBN-39]TQL01035.1 ricin-type beta-trefoil lectin protein [Cellulomonas sp. SLBN-39]